MSTYELNNLPEEVKEVLTNSHHLKNVEVHRKEVLNKNFFKKNDDSNTNDLFGSMLEDAPNVEMTPIELYDSKVIWGTDNYIERGEEYNFKKPANDFNIIVPRVDKSKAEQKRRVKEKAEVFTPSWVCNAQNNLIDDHIFKPGVFNTMSEDKKTWTPSKGSVKFKKGSSWIDYVVERRIELTCGEAPYLMSPYDTTTGVGIPVRDDKGLFGRIGLLDRKLRIVTENVLKDVKKNRKGQVSDYSTISEEIKESWISYAMLALVNTFGYEWQGDNLLLARLNFLNTYIEYRMDALGSMPDNEEILDVAEIASWNLWQMDGLKMVEPMSCSDTCKACKTKKRAGHDGRVSVMRFLTSNGFVIKAFEDLLPSEMFAKK